MGIMPGIGTSLILLTFFPFLMAITPLHVLSFYIALRVSSQFSSSVSAILFGMLGEITSNPALRERHHLIENNLVYKGIIYTAIGSIIATMLALLFSYLLLFQSDLVLYMLRSLTMFSMMCVVVIVSCFWSNNRVYQNLLLITVGLILGAIGFDPVTGSDILTFGNMYLSSGIPMLTVMTGFIAAPIAYKILVDQDQPVLLAQSFEPKWSQSFTDIPWWAMVRGSIIGWIAGLVPVLGTAASSNIAWRAETFLQKKTAADICINRLVAAEAANNSAVISVLIPLLLFGIAIISSEMIVLDIISTQGWGFRQFSQADYIKLAAASLISILVAYVLCGPWVALLTEFFTKHHYTMAIMVLFITIMSVLIMGNYIYSLYYYFVLLVVFCFFGIMFRRQDATPLVLSYLAAEPLINSSRVVLQLYI